MLLDPSLYGVTEALKKAGKVLLYHVFSAAVVAGFAAAAEDLGKLQINHPLYAVYLASAIASVNVLAVFVTKWLSSVDPEKLNSSASSDAALGTDNPSGITG